MAAVLAGFAAVEPNFLSLTNLVNVADQEAGLVAMATGLGIVMTMRGVDLSVADAADAAALVAALMIIAGQPVWLAVVTALLMAILVGMANGFMMAYLGIPAIIGTLGTLFVLRGSALLLAGGSQVQVLFGLPASQTGALTFLGQGHVGWVPTSYFVIVGVVLAAYILTRRTPFGRYADAIGGNVRTSYLSGVRTRRVFFGGFVASSVLAGIGGIVLLAHNGLTSAGALEPLLLDCFVSVYLGMLVVPSGRISVVGTAVGAYIDGLLGNALTLLGLGAASHYLVYGLVILIGVSLGTLRHVGQRREGGG